jgi:hypothetical protein
MPFEFDASDFVDSDFQAAQKTTPTPSAPPAFGVAPPMAPTPPSQRPPTREELDSRVGEMQKKLLELKRAQDDLERARAAVEEARRRQVEFQTGREEVKQQLVRATGLIEEAEFAARQEAEQLAKTLGSLREALGKVQDIHDETWTKDSYNVELTRALTTIENARMELNAAKLKWPVLAGKDPNAPGDTLAKPPLLAMVEGLSLRQACKIGLALTWPLAVVSLLAFVVFLIALLTRR